ncbi:hypothetical protein G6F56_008777 [Rhizopus delemar]|nr:hypothetical protein G6F56_008777 [Rhizopus delemar]
MQIKCKEERKPPVNDKKKTHEDDLLSYLSTDDDDENTPVKTNQPQVPLFVVDDFDLQVDTADDNMLDLFKEEDFFLTGDWSNVLSQSAFL